MPPEISDQLHHFIQPVIDGSLHTYVFFSSSPDSKTHSFVVVCLMVINSHDVYKTDN